MTPIEADELAHRITTALEDELRDAGHHLTMTRPLPVTDLLEACDLLETTVADFVARAEQRLR